MKLEHRLAVARGDEPADLLLKNGRVVNVFTGEVEQADVAVAGSHIAGLGAGYRAREVLDLEQAFVAPGLIDAHVHVESSMVPPREFGSVVVPHGVTAVVTDPHEIANVLGLEGIRFMIADASGGPLAVFVNASSCVPATHLATAGAALTAEDLASLLEGGEVLGLAEVMNYPGVISGDPLVLDKIRAFAGRPIDGHSPGLTGQALNAYVAAGIRSDHECTTVEEARAKIGLGMTVFVREGTAARNLAALLPAVSPANERRFCFCSDDRHINDLIEEGSIDHMVRRAVAGGLDPVTAIRMGSLNAAEHFGLSDRGAVAPGRVADLVVFRDLACLRAERVYVGGRLVARDGRMLEFESRAPSGPRGGTVRVDWPSICFEIPAEGNSVRAIGVVPDQLVTEHRVEPCTVVDSRATADPRRDLLKMAVIERHGATGNVGLGFVRGIGLKRGAIAGTVAHDHHNLVVIGVDDRSMMTAARAAAEAGGGLVAADGETVRAVLPLPVAGLMTDAPAAELAGGLREVVSAARELGSRLHDPFMTMSFLSLEVIPSLKLTDRGLVDVERMELVPLFTDVRGGILSDRLEPLFTREEVEARVHDLARRLDRDYADVDELCLVGVLKGAFIFLADLARRLSVRHRIDFVALASYGDSSSAGDVRLIMDLRSSIQGRHVLVVDDIFDTGGTLEHLQKILLARQPASVRTCVLVRKKKERPGDLHVDYVGFDIPDAWVVGYGLDFADRYRTLPHIAILTVDEPPAGD